MVQRLIVLLLLSSPALAQFTTVSATVHDPSGLPYSNGTVTFTLVISGTPILGGFPYSPPTQAIGLDARGTFVQNLASNTVLTPAGSTWSFHVCSAAGTVQPGSPITAGPVCFDVKGLTITGISQDISAQLNAVAPPLAAPPITTTGVTSITAGTGITLSSNPCTSTCTISAPTTGGGTVTSVTAGTGLTATPNPITGAGTINLVTPVGAANGGTGANLSALPLNEVIVSTSSGIGPTTGGRWTMTTVPDTISNTVGNLTFPGSTGLPFAFNNPLQINGTGANTILTGPTTPTGPLTFSTPISAPGLGTVTSVSCNDSSLTCTPNPITGSGTIILASPVSTANGGTGVNNAGLPAGNIVGNNSPIAGLAITGMVGLNWNANAAPATLQLTSGFAGVAAQECFSGFTSGSACWTTNGTGSQMILSVPSLAITGLAGVASIQGPQVSATGPFVFSNNITSAASQTCGTTAPFNVGGTSGVSMGTTATGLCAGGSEVFRASNTTTALMPATAFFCFTGTGINSAVDVCLNKPATGLFSFNTGGATNGTAIYQSGNTCYIAPTTVGLTATTLCSFSLPAFAKTWLLTCNAVMSNTSASTDTISMIVNPSATPATGLGFSAEIVAGASAFGGAVTVSASGPTTILSQGVPPTSSGTARIVGSISLPATAGTVAFQMLSASALNVLGGGCRLE